MVEADKVVSKDSEVLCLGGGETAGPQPLSFAPSPVRGWAL